MLSRDDFIDYLWENVIEVDAKVVMQNLAADAATEPDTWEGKVGAAMQRLMRQGASIDDLGEIMRWASYEATFGVLYAANEPGVESLDGLYEDLRSADPRE